MDWSVDPGALLSIALAEGLYLRALAVLRGRGVRVPTGQKVCWHVGLTLWVLALLTPLARLAQDSLLFHMAEHLLIADLGALLLVLGLTGPMLAPLLRTTALGWLRHLAHPVPAFGLWAADLFFWHLVGPHEAVVENPLVHAVQHLLFVGLGINVWMALLGPLPKPAWFGNLARLIYIVVVRLTSTVLANVFVWSNDAYFGVYAEGERAHGISPQTDQVVAGSIMMVEGSILTLCLFCWLFLRSAREGQERQELLDLAAAGGVALDERRAARAVSAGRGGELKRRIEEERTR